MNRSLVIYFFFISIFSYAQEADEREELPIIPKNDSSYVGEAQLGKKKNIRFTPFLAPSYAPETDFMIIAGGLLSFHIDPENPRVQRSSLPFSVGYSTNSSFMANFRPVVFFKDDRNRLSGDLWMKIMPDNYWGVGYENGKHPSKPDSTTQYNRSWWQVLIKYTHRFGNNLFGGVLLDVNQTVAAKLNPSMQEDYHVRKDGTNIFNASLGLLFQYDTRDITVNAYRGMLLEFSSNFYGQFLGGDFDYKVIIIDYRQYKTIRREGRTIAWQVKTRLGTNDVPWSEMSFLGTPFDLRGYRWGRYRDRTALFGIAEYRHMFMRKKPRKDGDLMSRFGLVTWLAGGSIGDNPGDLSDWLPNGGVGIRFEVQKRMNARLDFGIGQDSNAFYVSFNEAF